ncbi:hypothetical protein JIG36_34920 [Actinoplanes sp. LDG1-06]|uniref:Oxidoreductase n=1 Tax=Paractinoplanes ovalisporus TaxID=2810368 RepID=A0ABS2ALP2_9ACTN|nr:hypothetical protein [Actinoplanes ovalisporus]MBM2620705.1 hypothetical protein [Actinoplanes ovalisporus]
MLGTTKRRLRRAYRNGTRLDLGGAEVTGDFLADLLLGGAPGAAGRVARLDLENARITGELDLTSARIETQLRLRHCVFDAKLRLDHAELVSLNLDGSRLPGIAAEGIRVAGVFGVRDATVDGDIWMLPALVQGMVELDRSTVNGTVYLQRSEIGGGVHLRGVTVTGGVKLAGSRVGGDVVLEKAHIGPSPDNGTAVGGWGMTVGGAFLAHDIVADGPVHLVGAQVTGSMSFQGSALRSPGQYCLLLIEAQARVLTLRLTAESAGTISLRDARFGRFVDDPVNWPAGCRIELDGLTYDRLTRRSEDVEAWTAKQRLAWMARHSTGFSPGPYDQLAAALTRDGREQEARQVLVVRERLRHRAMGTLGSLWGSVQNVAIGFGYRPLRALLWLLVVVAAGTGWFAWSGPLQAVKPDEAPTWDPFLYTVDVLVPLVDLGHDKAWDPVGPDKAVTLAVMAAGWILATTVIAGAGRALRR